MISDGSPSRILVVEDEYLVAEDIACTLEELGYEVLGPVATIEEALALVESEKPDGVLLDANLDGTSSAPIAAELIARSVPFVVVTGYGSLELAAGALDRAPRLSKPFESSALDRAVRSAFVASGAR